MRLFYLTCSFLFILLLWGLSAYGYSLNGELEGEVEFSYADFSSQRSGQDDIEASHFTQKYSVYYEKEDVLYQGRLGHFSVGLGAEWFTLDSEINGRSQDVDNFKLLYNGSITIAPGALPFQARLYAMDNHKTYFSTGGFTDYEVIQPDINTGVLNGTYQTIGATLVAGIKNGSYRGQYRDVLAKFPRLLLDYRQDHIRALKNSNRVHTLTRNLAFISLNKKDNWFHYRYKEHINYLDQKESFTRKNVILGSIDHKLRRQWINLTNWIEISADLGYMEEDSYQRTSVNVDPYQVYYLNFIAKAQRNGTSAFMPTHFSRSRSHQSYNYNLNIPLYFDHVISPESKLHVNAIGSSERDVWGEIAETQLNGGLGPSLGEKIGYEEDSIFLQTYLETRMRQKYHIDYAFEAAATEKSYVGGISAVRLEAKAYSNYRYRNKSEWLVGYSIGHFSGGDANKDYIEQELTAEYSKRINNKLRVGVSQTLMAGAGEYDESATSKYLAPRMKGYLKSIGVSGSILEGEAVSSSTSVYVDSVIANFSNSLKLTYFVARTEDDESDEFEVSHRLNRRSSKLNIDIRTKYVQGDSVSGGYSLYSDNLSIDNSVTSGNGERLDHYGHIKYIMSRNYKAGVNWKYFTTRGDVGSYSSSKVAQTFEYSRYKKNGRIRRIFSLTEKLEFENLKTPEGDYDYVYFNLDGVYYPSKVTFFKAGFRYVLSNSNSELQAVYCGIGANWPKFRISLDYEYGTKEDELVAGVEEVKDERWEVKVNKYF